MQTVLKGGRLIRAVRGVACQLNRHTPSRKPSGVFRLKNQGGSLRNSSSMTPGRRAGAEEGRHTTFRTFSSGGGGSGAGGSSGGGGGGGGSGGSGKGGSSGGLWAAYLALLERKPLATKAVSSGVLNALGDIIAQLAFEQGADFDWKRLSIFTLLGAAYIGPALHFWYGSLGRIVTAKGTAGTLTKLALDQLCFAPIFISSILGLLMTLEGKAASVPDKLRQDLFMIVRSNWALWVPFQFINFGFVPPNLQVLASNVCSLGWNTYMSYMTHRKDATH